MPTMPTTHRATSISYERQHERKCSRSILQTRQWRKLRKTVRADTPLCVACIANGEVVPAVDVDHIVPRSQGGSPFDPANLQPLCKRCHSLKTRREGISKNLEV